MAPGWPRTAQAQDWPVSGPGGPGWGGHRRRKLHALARGPRVPRPPNMNGYRAVSQRSPHLVADGVVKPVLPTGRVLCSTRRPRLAINWGLAISPSLGRPPSGCPELKRRHGIRCPRPREVKPLARGVEAPRPVGGWGWVGRGGGDVYN